MSNNASLLKVDEKNKGRKRGRRKRRRRKKREDRGRLTRYF